MVTLAQFALMTAMVLWAWTLIGGFLLAMRSILTPSLWQGWRDPLALFTLGIPWSAGVAGWAWELHSMLTSGWWL